MLLMVKKMAEQLSGMKNGMKNGVRKVVLATAVAASIAGMSIVWANKLSAEPVISKVSIETEPKAGDARNSNSGFGAGVAFGMMVMSLLNLGMRAYWEQKRERIKLDSTLRIAAGNGELEQMEELLKKGADVNAQDCDGLTPLHRAIENDNLESVKLLIRKGADVNTEDYNGRTPLYWTSLKQNIKIISALIEGGANVNVEDNNDRT